MKSIAKILIPMTGYDRDGAALTTAFGLAASFDARVEALFAHPNPQAPRLIGVPLAPGLAESVVGGQEAFAREAEKSARTMLSKMPTSVVHSFRSEMGPLSDAIVPRARLCDTVVFPTMRLPGFFDIVESFVSVLTHVQRPVVVAAEASSVKPWRTVAIGWNGSRSAARAMMASVPLLKRAEKVFILSVAEEHRLPAADELEQYLALHGIKAVRKSARLGPPSVGDMLVQGATDLGADLLVIGGYGHSHLREAFLGGVTADVLARARTPVFLSH